MNVDECQQSREGFPRPFPDTPTNVLEQFLLTDKVVVVTGAADGIGYAVAEAMAEANANVALLYNSQVGKFCTSSSIAESIPGTMLPSEKLKS